MSYNKKKGAGTEKQYFCQKCKHYHRYDSKIGEQHAGKWALMSREIPFYW